MKNKVLNKGGYLVFKRVTDLFISIIALPFALLLIAFFSIIIKLESKGPIIYCQDRVGKNGKIFIIYKLRSMYMNAESNGPQWAQQNDLRITKVGRILRKTRIDEVPQVFNILKGDMSIVGPRPERPYFINEFTEIYPDFSERLKVSPGLTGWAQVNGGYEISVQEKLEKDLYYIAHQSFILDVIIIFKTIRIVFGRIGAR